MFKEPKWIKDTKIARKMHGEILDSKDGEILVMRPAKVSEYDDHMEHIKAHNKALKELEDDIRGHYYSEEAQEILRHVLQHRYAMLNDTQNSFGVQKLKTGPKKPK